MIKSELKQATAYKDLAHDSQNNALNLTPIWSLTSSITGAESLFTTIIDNTNDKNKTLDKCKFNRKHINFTY